MRLFRRKRSRLPVGIQLFSVHIPKTAGTSFRHLLKAVYGAEGVARIDLPLGGRRLRINEQDAEPQELAAEVSVLHGHYNPAELNALFPRSADQALITWLRDPVDRVISNYFYLSERLAEELDEAGKQLNILSKMQRSLLEYARDEINRNRQHKFLAGVPLTEFDFVGIQEYYDEEVKAMAKAFQWPPQVEAPKHNRTGKKRAVSAAERAEIAALNALDVELYEEGLALREARLGPPKIELISLHIPKTGGTSFYQSLRLVYGQALSISYRRADYQSALDQYGSLLGSLNGNKGVLHGHLCYFEIQDIHRNHEAKLICWLRHPLERLLSNYHFFKAGLADPDRNYENYRKNKHRKKESLLTYAAREENQNVMQHFIRGARLEDFFFIGFLDDYEADVARLGRLLDWPEISSQHLNPGRYTERAATLDEATRRQLLAWNAEDLELYERAKKLKHA